MELGELKSVELVEYQTLLIENEKLKQDIDQYKLENNNLKQSVSDYKDYAESFVASYLEYRALEHENDTLKSENKALRLQANEYFDLWQEAIKK